MSGFTQKVRDVVFDRAGGRCERCGRVQTHYEYHHRRPRGMGGSKAADTNTVSNCALLCQHCHRDVESNREDALAAGWIVAQNASPADTPIEHWTQTALLLDNSYKQASR